MDRILLQPTPEIRAICSLLNEGIGLFLEARRTLPPLGRYESEDESLNLMYLNIRHIESISALANYDLVLLPSALAVTRLLLETSTKIKWMLYPDDPMQREARWLVHLKSEEEYLDKVVDRLSRLGADTSYYTERRNATHNFRTQVSDRLPRGTRVLKSVPDMASMLSSVGEPEKYVEYIRLSQFIHGTHSATSIYRKNLGINKELGEFTRVSDWALPLQICWYIIGNTGVYLLQKLRSTAPFFISHDMANTFRQHITAVIGS